jgi:nitrite reductase/ring-hydroxylating ferredoxin subunit
MKEVLFNNQEFNEALDRLDQLMQDAESMADVDNKVLLYNVLQYFDSIHREPLSRIMNALGHHPDLKTTIVQDETVQKLCALYDLPIEAAPTENSGVMGFVPVSDVGLLTPRKQKDWLELGNYEELEHLKLYPKNYEKVNFVISRIGSDVFAVQNQCDGSVLPIDKGTVEDHFLTCPWHGCKYDLKTGKAVNRGDKKLETFAVEIEDDGLLKVEIAY